MKSIVILALDGMLDSGLAIAMDTFRTANAFAVRARRTGGLRIGIAGHRKTVRTMGGFRIDCDLGFQQVRGADWLVIPGLGLTSAAALDARFAARDARAAMELLRGEPAKHVAAACSSAFLLAEAGLLDAKHATTTWWLAQAFRSRYPGVRLDEMRMLVRDGRYVTAGSAFAQLDLSLAIVTETCGVAVADLCSRYLLIDHRPSQALYMIESHVQHADATVVAAERWIDRNLARDTTITRLASAMAMSPKTLARRVTAATGLSPLKLVQRRRLLHAVHLLETTPMTIDAIAERVGYQDGTALRKIVKRELGTTPGALRTRS